MPSKTPFGLVDVFHSSSIFCLRGAFHCPIQGLYSYPSLEAIKRTISRREALKLHARRCRMFGRETAELLREEDRRKKRSLAAS